MLFNKNLIDLINSEPISTTIFIILCVTVIVWQILNKMMAQETDNGLEAKIIRSLILARGQGATLQDIKHDYLEEIGRKLEFGGKSDLALRKWIENIDYIKTTFRNGHVLYFSEAPEQEHLAKLIRKQRKRTTRSFRNQPKPGLYTTIVPDSNDKNYSTPKSWRNSLVFRRSKLANYAFGGDQKVKNATFKQPRMPNHICAQPKAPKQSLRMDSSSLMRSTRKKFSRFSNSDEDDYDYNNNVSRISGYSNMTGMSNVSCMTERFAEKDKREPSKPEFFKCVVVGDNFFLNLAVLNMGFRLSFSNRIMQSGFCISGQTIDEVTSLIPEMDPSQPILLNIGSVDIMQGKEVIELFISMMQLLDTCKKHNVTPVLTTLLPIANHRFKHRKHVMDEFNKFLLCNPFNFPVIDLHEAFIKSDGTMDINCFQTTTRYNSGFRKPLVLWNRVGRQRIINILKREIGSAILKILLK